MSSRGKATHTTGRATAERESGRSKRRSIGYERALGENREGAVNRADVQSPSVDSDLGQRAACIPGRYRRTDCA